MVRFGEVWKIPFPYADSAEFKARPVVVVGASPMGPAEEQVLLVAMITSKVHQRRNGDVPIPDHQAVGLPRPSLVKARRLFSASPSMFAQPVASRIGRLELVTLDAVLNEIAVLFLP